MELKAGYKWTEVGLIPEEWQPIPVAQLVEPGAPICYGVVQVGQDTNNGIPIVAIKYVKEVDRAPLHRASVAFEQTYARSRVKGGDILISIKGTIGRVGIVPQGFVGNISRELARLRPTKEYSGQYIAYQLESDGSQARISKAVVGTTRLEFSIAALRQFQLPVPKSLDEQRAIAAALSDVDALLEGLARLIAKKRDLKQAAMQQLLTGRTRLPGFHGEWEVKTLRDCLLLGPDYGINAAAVPFSDGLPAYIRITDISEEGRFCPDPRVSVQARNCDQYYLHDGDVVFARTGASVGKSYLYEPNDGQLVFAGFLIRVRPNPDQLVPKFLSAYAMTSMYWDWVRLMSMRSGQPGINGHEYAQMVLCLPSVAEQTAIAAVLSDIDAELAALEARRRKTRALKQAMMQELLTGRTRLVAPIVTESRKDSERIDGRQANIYFKRSVLAAEIIDRLHDEPTFGHVKFEKMIFLVEHLCDVDTGSTYHRDAAGPYDNRALRSIDSQLRKQKWFDAQKIDDRYRYEPLANRGKHKEYFERYFGGVGTTFDTVIETFRGFTTERCEIVATLFGAWRDLLQQNDSVSDDAIVNEVLKNWHKSKERIPEERWRKALSWMRDRGFVPRKANGA